MEKQTEYYGRIYITKLLNINDNVYYTEGNKELFNNKFPDAWILNGDNLLIIEYKANSKDTKQGLTQLFYYCKQVVSKVENKNINIYCFLGIGTNENMFEKYFMVYNDGKLKRISENNIKNIFCNITENVNVQNIHNILVKNFHFDKAEELHDILTIILTSFINDDLVNCYEYTNYSPNMEFIDMLITNAKDVLDSENYNKYLNIIKETNFENCFVTCKSIYSAYKQDYSIISKLFQQFKKYNKYTLSKNEIWTDDLVVNIMFNEIKKYIDITKELTICDPCVGGGNLLKPFIQQCKQLNIKCCEINKRLSMNIKL